MSTTLNVQTVRLLNMSNLKGRIIEAMVKAGMSQVELSRAADVSRGAVSLWCSGQTKNLAGDNLTRVARALGVDAHWLATGEHREAKDGFMVSEPSSTYNADEKKLLARFRALNENDKSRALALLDVLVKNPPRIKP